MVRVLTDDDVAALLDLEDLLPVIESAFVRQGRGEVERPERPHFPVGVGLDPDDPEAASGTGLTMSAYIHGASHFVTKVVGINPDNEARGLPTVNGLVLANEATTGVPAAVMAGNRITNARTACIGGLAARHLAADSPVTVGVIGAGTQARWQTRAIAAATDVAAVRVYSPSDSKRDCAADLADELDVATAAVESPTAAVTGTDVVVTATTATEPVFPGEALEPGTLVIAVGAFTPDTRELDVRTFARAARVVADVPPEVATIGDLAATALTAADLVPLSAVFEGDVGRESPEEIIVVESVGTAVLDAATAEYLLEAAEARGVGTTLSLG